MASVEDVNFKRPLIWTKDNVPPDEADLTGWLAEKFAQQQRQNREFENTIKLNLDRLELLLRDLYARVSDIENRIFGNLLQMSWYGAAHQGAEQMASDIAAFNDLGYNSARVWATWSYQNLSADVGSPINYETGLAQEPMMSGLKRFMDQASSLGWVVEITLSHNKLESLAAHNQAVQTLAENLGGYTNWYLDLANEFEGIQWSLVGPFNLATDQLVGVPLTASVSGPNASLAGVYQDFESSGATLDLYTPHFYPDAEWVNIDQRASNLAGELGVPNSLIFENEPNGLGRTNGAAIPSSDIWTAYGENARSAGVKGVNFFTVLGFDLRGGGSLYDRLEASTDVDKQGYKNLATGWLG